MNAPLIAPADKVAGFYQRKVVSFKQGSGLDGHYRSGGLTRWAWMEAAYV